MILAQLEDDGTGGLVLRITGPLLYDLLRNWTEGKSASEYIRDRLQRFDLLNPDDGEAQSCQTKLS